MASFNTVYRKNRQGSWKSGSQSKEDQLRDIFVEIASTSPNNDSATITPHALLLALRDHSSSLNEYFGKKSTDDILTAFSALDVEGQGAVTLSQFMKGASHALSGAGEKVIHEELTTPKVTLRRASQIGGDTVPKPPPMSREMLYRSVFNAVDKEKKGWVSLKKLLNAMKSKRSELTKVFGPQRADRALKAFSILDADRTGKVTFEQFFTGAELAFTNRVSQLNVNKNANAPPAPPSQGKFEVPKPPPMTRDLLYRSVYKSIDTKNNGYISQKDLVKAMSKRRSSVSMIFGHSTTEHALEVFGKLDSRNSGAVNYEQFYKNCEEAFLVDEKASEGPKPPAVNAGREQDIPAPPPMTRELLYRSVYDEIDTMKNGTITQIDLVRAMRKGRRSSVAKIFGENALQNAVQAFQDMDVDGRGEVSWKQFFTKAEEAFVENPEKRLSAPRRESLKMRRASLMAKNPPKPPPLPPQ